MSLSVTRRGDVEVLTIDRPEARNAFDDALIAALTAAVERTANDAGVRVIVLAAAGTVFSAGGDLQWMRRMAEASREANLADARALARLLRAIDTCPKPTIARIQGSAFGGALGLIAAADIAIAVPEAEFSASEVRLGLIPATVAPYVVRAIGVRAARRLFLTAERIPAAEALALGLVHRVVRAGSLDPTVDGYTAALRAGGPEAMDAAKRLVVRVAGAIDDAAIEDTARMLADVRTGAEAHEGIAAFFAKRKPRWNA